MTWKFEVENDPRCNREGALDAMVVEAVATFKNGPPGLECWIVTPSGKRYQVKHGDRTRMRLELGELQGIQEADQ